MINTTLAPMAGYTDIAFREIAAQHHVQYTVTEMVSAKALVYGDAKTKDLLRLAKGEKDVAVQLFGSEPDIMGEAASILSQEPFFMIDINMGCPAPKIVKNQCGSALLEDESRVYDIVKAVVKSTNKPVSVKIRKGIGGKLSLRAAQNIEAAGASLITVHGRTREQYYTGKSDWDYIKKVKESLTIPVYGNGDIFSLEDCVQKVDISGVDGVSIGRGAVGNPYLFDEIYCHYHNIKYTPPDWKQRLELLIHHLKKEVEYKGNALGTVQMRKVYPYYFKSMPDSKEVRARLNTMGQYEDCIALIENYVKKRQEKALS